MKILFSNLGYAKGIDGTLGKHLLRAGRYFYCPMPVQASVLAQFKAIMAVEKPELCCLVEIDRGSFQSGYYNQLQALMDEDYRFHDIANKYGEGRVLGKMPLHAGKSNAFLSRAHYAFEKFYFQHGTKRLIYRVFLPDQRIWVFFAHFSLRRKVRARQLEEMRKLVELTPGNVILLADFNIHHGFSELAPLLRDMGLSVLSKETEPTFLFHRRRMALDLCICSQALVSRASLQVIPQPFSDHAALLVEVDN